MATTYYYTVDSEIIGEHTTGQSRIDYLTDALGSVVSTVDQSQTVTSTARYKPYGDDLAVTGSRPVYGWNGMSGYRRTGRPHAQGYVRNRILSTTDGRWTTVDPLWPKEHSYSYSGQNPASLNDPTGLTCALRFTKGPTLRNVKCSSRCLKHWWDPCSYVSGRCYVDMEDSLSYSYSIRGCSGCNLYQWKNDGSGWRRDDGEGWPYPSACSLYKGVPDVCSSNDNPFTSVAFVPCNSYYEDSYDLITCVCCSGKSICFSWGYVHNADGCQAFCDLKKVKLLTSSDASNICGLGHPS